MKFVPTPFVAVCLVAVCSASAFSRPLAGDARPAAFGTLAADIQGLLEAVNVQRRDRGLRPLTVDARLNQAAGVQARYLARSRRLDHRGPDGSTVGRRAERAGYDWSSVGENLALSSSSSPRVVVQMWMNSRGHRANMLNRAFTQAGAAHVGTIWVLVLARPRS